MRLTMQNERELRAAIRGAGSEISSNKLIRVHGITLTVAVAKQADTTAVTIYPASDPSNVIYHGTGTAGACYADAADAIEGAIV
ncbi:hypothetical protein MWU49_09230 [Alcanivorax sp. S6407]|uniref:hypothetical protein n=1 Tax=Alcanivorax sp. S6407 TaxID=2926424 RepID=UPI001FF4E210|nr:hypothetical protein [Alcanivorax sp. S6407]MCK0153885.1 hypothetical protein [Alcanivorax sp. S6407]